VQDCVAVTISPSSVKVDLHERAGVGVDAVGEVGERRAARQAHGLAVAAGDTAAHRRRGEVVELLTPLLLALLAADRTTAGAAEGTGGGAAATGTAARAAGTAAEATTAGTAGEATAAAGTTGTAGAAGTAGTAGATGTGTGHAGP
jgi:hypothetical protein